MLLRTKKTWFGFCVRKKWDLFLVSPLQLPQLNVQCTDRSTRLEPNSIVLEKIKCLFWMCPTTGL